MNFNFISRVSRLAAIGAILCGSASCVYVNEELGENFIPTDQKWDVFTPDPVELKEIRLQMSDSLSAYSSTRLTFGSVTDDVMGTTVKSTSFTLVPIADTLNFGENPVVRQFHFNALRDTLSTVYDNQIGMIQNVYVSELKRKLDTTVLYTGTFMNEKAREEFLDLDNRITAGVPVYAGGDTLSFDFSKEYAQTVISRLQGMVLDSMATYLDVMPGIYITTDAPVGNGGRINMFQLPIATDSYGYISANYAQLKITSKYGDRENVDTSFLFYFGPTEQLEAEAEEFPDQYAFNGSEHDSNSIYSGEGVVAGENIYVEGGSGVKPVVKAAEIRRILEEEIGRAGIRDISEVVINKATIILPYDVNGDYSALDRYPDILTPTVRLRSSSNSEYITYAGLTDSSIETENQGDINRSVSMYSPDISHHVQEILKLDETAEDYEKTLEKYDIWFLIMHEEVTESSSSSSSYSDYYNNLAYSSYYNNMMYDPYGYGYGYGGYGYGYGSYGYGSSYYNNYYNYMLMSMYASSYSSSDTSTSTELDKDRYYNGVLCGPDAAGDRHPAIKLTFSAPKTAE